MARLAATEPGGPDSVIELPDALYLHVFIARGEVDMEGVGPLYEGDAVRMTRSGGQRITARMPSEVLVWEMHARLGGP